MTSTAAQGADYRKRRHLAGRPLSVDATGTRRRVQALAAIGVPLRQVAATSRVGLGQLADVANGRYARVHLATADAVRRAYRAHAGRPAVDNVTARRAAAKRWAPPAAWDAIDDPAAQPIGVGASSTARRPSHETAAEHAHLSAFGLTDETIADRLGMKPASLHAALGRNAA